MKLNLKRASTLLAVATALLVGATAIFILGSLSAMTGISKGFRTNVTAKFNREGLLSVALDGAVQEMMEASATANKVVTAADCSLLADEVFEVAAPSGVFDTPGAEALTMEINLPQLYRKQLLNSMGRYSDPQVSCRLKDTLSIIVDDQAAEIGSSAEFDINTFRIKVVADSGKKTSYRVWEVTGAKFVVERIAGSGTAATGHISLADATFSIVEQTI